MAPSAVDIQNANQIINKLKRLQIQSFKKPENGKWISAGKWVHTHIEMLDRFGIEAFYGATKIVFIHPSLGDWVLKTNWHVYDEIDYCSLEYKHYMEAIEEGYDDYLAPIYKVETDDGLQWYLQQKVVADEARISNYIYENASEEDFEEAGVNPDSEYSRDELLENMEREDKIRVLFEDEEFYSWIEKIMERDNVNSDLHEGNIGICEDGHFVIFDYSGY